MKVDVIPSTRAHYTEAFGMMPPTSVRSRTFMHDGKPAGMVGWYLTGLGWMVFSDIFMDVPKMTIYRQALSAMRDVPSPAICYAAPQSWKFLHRLGWEHTGRGDENGAFLKWQH